MSTTSQTRTRTQPELDDAFDAELEEMALQHSAPQLDEPDQQPGLPRYLRWQARDFLKHRALLMLPLAIIALWIFRYNFDAEVAARVGRGSGDGAGQSEPMLFRMIVMGASLLMGGVGSVFSAAGIVSREREGGFQRFLFAKPLRITSYYLQTYVVNGIGLLAMSGAMLALTSLVFLRPVPIVEPLLAIGAMYVAVGGLTFLMSTLVRLDFAVAAVLAVLSFPLQQAAERGYWWAIATSWLLPPLHKLEAFAPNPRGATGVANALGSLVTYGVAYIAAGVAVLRRRSIIR
jgi:hypothetical protein